MTSTNSRIVIVGGGAWGLSTALHLLNKGHTDITVLEKAETIPSQYSGAYDLNKIVRAEYEDPFYTKLALQAMRGWRTRLFGPYFHQTGYVVAATGKAPPKAIEHLEKALSSIEKDPNFAAGISRLDDASAFREAIWQLDGPLNGFKGYLNRTAGYAHSSDAMKGIWEHISTRGVRCILGESHGQARELIYNSDGKCTGVRTADGRVHAADLVIVALGANAASLLPKVGEWVVARAWSVAHVQLTEEECNLLRGIPVVNVRDLGFFFEPDPKTRLFKLCPLGIGYTNPQSNGISLPPGQKLPSPQDFIPYADEQKLRQLLREMFPWMADRPFVEQRLCWFADTKDSDYCIDYVPGTQNSVICVTGDSGHGFKMMPVFGEWVVDLIARGQQHEPRWQWRNRGPTDRNWGESVSWRIGKGAELKDLEAAKAKLIRARL